MAYIGGSETASDIVAWEGHLGIASFVDYKQAVQIGALATDRTSEHSGDEARQRKTAQRVMATSYDHPRH